MKLLRQKGWPSGRTSHHICITRHPGFHAACLNRWVLQTARYQYKRDISDITRYFSAELFFLWLDDIQRKLSWWKFRLSVTHHWVEKRNLPLAVRLLRNCAETFPLYNFWVWVATSTTAGNVSSAFIVNRSYFHRKLAAIPPSRVPRRSWNGWTQVSIIRIFWTCFLHFKLINTSFNFLLNIP